MYREMFALLVLLVVNAATIDAGNKEPTNRTSVIDNNKIEENVTATNRTLEASAESSTFAYGHRPYTIGGIAVLAVIVVGLLKCGLCGYYAKRYIDNPESIVNRADDQFAYRNL